MLIHMCALKISLIIEFNKTYDKIYFDFITLKSYKEF